MNLFDNRSVGFDEPIEMLYAYHGKIRRFCAQIVALPNYIAQHGRNTTVLNTVHQIRRYFHTAAPLHHQDEEQDFFPLLLEYAPKAKATTDALSAQHTLLHQAWLKTDVELAHLESEPNHQPDAATLYYFSDAYQKHIILEEPLFVLGKNSIPTHRLHKIGINMAKRRQSA